MISDKKNISNNINIIIINKIGRVNIDNQFSKSKIKNFIRSELLK